MRDIKPAKFTSVNMNLGDIIILVILNCPRIYIQLYGVELHLSISLPTPQSLSN